MVVKFILFLVDDEFVNLWVLKYVLGDKYSLVYVKNGIEVLWVV